MTNPENKDARTELIVKLYELFRQRGYEGVSIGDISEATGLGRSSLYHHFPGGKDEMAEAVIAFTREALDGTVFAALRGADPVDKRIDAMLAEVRRVYSGGATPCVLAALLNGAPDSALVQATMRLFAEWSTILAQTLEEGGLSAPEARRRSRAMLSLLQGGLVMTRALKDKSVFDESLKLARTMLLADLT
jgi:AcrR family transcriptional regulator